MHLIHHYLQTFSFFNTKTLIVIKLSVPTFAHTSFSE